MSEKDILLDYLLSSEESLLCKAVLGAGISTGSSPLYQNGKWSKINNEALSHPIFQYWLSQLPGKKTLSALHGSFDSCFENACGKCLQFGFTIQDNEFKSELDPYLQWFFTLPPTFSEISYSYDFYRNLLAFHLLRAGYEHQSIIETVQFRLRQVYDFVKQDRYDIYISSEDFPAMPKNFQNKPFVDPALFQNGMSVFPNIHDMIAFRYYNQKMATTKEKEWINRIVQYIANSRYQSIQEGYGVMFAPPKSYYSIGWSVHFNGHNKLFGYALCHVFPAFQSSVMGKEMFRLFESFQLPDHTYEAPSVYLQEKTGYLVSGSHMGMGLNRRKKNWRQLESSFWLMLS